ncbi:MAG: imidazole glycerol phosphate synthase subunit HisH [Candidatus Omnitrophota bacterium]
MTPKQKVTVAVVDYGLGNLFSIERALKHIGADCLITDNKDAIINCERVILPGVGAFADAMKGLEAKGLIGALNKIAEKKVPLLGICLGMQLMMTESEEFGRHNGLGLVCGKVVRLQETPSLEARTKVPHIGWNTINGSDGSRWEKTMLEGLENGEFMYFVHSYAVMPDEYSCVLATTTYGKDKFCSVMATGSIMGCQFHPEKSAEAGLGILRKFVFNNFDGYA